MTPKIEWRPVVVQAALMWLATRIAFALLTYATVILNGYGTARAAPGFIIGQWDLGTLIGVWARWDAGWYAQIAVKGYFSLQSAVFFPLYPALIHLLTLLTGSRFVILDALIVSNLAALIGFIGVALLATQEAGPAAASPSLRALAAYPLAFFLAAPYSEALLLASAAFAILWARRGAWWLTALAGFVAALSRPTAAILLLVIGWEFGRQHGWWSLPTYRAWSVGRLAHLRTWVKAIVVLGAVPLGIGLYAAYLWRRFGHPLLFAQEQATVWNHRVEPPWVSLRHAAGELIRNPFGTYWNLLTVIDVGAVLLVAVITLIAIRRQPVSFTLYVAGLLFTIVTAPILVLPDPYLSAARYLLLAIPALLLLGSWMRRWPAVDLLIVSAGFVLQAALTTYFLSGGWVA